MKLQSFFLLFCLCLATPAQGETTITDDMNRQVTLPDRIDRLLCSGPGCLRLIAYLQATDKVIAVDDMETRKKRFDARPYALAHPEFRTLPIFGQLRGQDSPERIVSLDPPPQMIFKTYAGVMGYDPVELQDKTGIPVVAVNYGDLSRQRPTFYNALRLMAKIIDRKARGEAVIAFFEETLADLQNRSMTGENTSPSVFLGGVSFKGPHGLQATQPSYPPFTLLGADNVAAQAPLSAKELRHTTINKEQLIVWDPDVLFLDLATLQMGEEAGGLFELRHDPAYRSLTAIQRHRVYGVLTYNWYTINYGSILANAYYIGTVLKPEAFADIDPVAKAESIFTFLLDEPIFTEMDRIFQHMVYQQIKVH